MFNGGVLNEERYKKLENMKATDKQKELARAISEELGVKMPEYDNRMRYTKFISTYINQFKRSKQKYNEKVKLEEDK